MLSRLKLQELRDEAGRRGLDTSGTKAVLIARLSEEEQPDASLQPEEEVVGGSATMAEAKAVATASPRFLENAAQPPPADPVAAAVPPPVVPVVGAEPARVPLAVPPPASDLGFFGAATGGALSDSEDEDEDAPPPPPPPPPPLLHAELAEAAPPLERKRKAGLLSPDEAAALVRAQPPSYVFQMDTEAGPAAAYIGTEASRRLELSDAVVTTLLAGGGRAIKAIEDSCSCRVIVDSGGVRGAMRMVTIVGSDASLREAERRLQDLVGQSADLTSRVLRCTAAQAGQLIGRGGATIKRLQVATCTHLDVSGRQGDDRSDELQRSVTIKGMPWHVENACKFIWSFWRDPEALEALLDEAQASSQKTPAAAVSSAREKYGDA